MIICIIRGFTRLQPIIFLVFQMKNNKTSAGYLKSAEVLVYLKSSWMSSIMPETVRAARLVYLAILRLF